MKHMKKIPIVKKDIFALVDDDDYEKLSKSVWYSCGGYAVCSKKVNDVWKRYIMHRIILNTPKGIVTDHINGDGMDKTFMLSKSTRNGTRKICNNCGIHSNLVSERNALIDELIDDVEKKKGDDDAYPIWNDTLDDLVAVLKSKKK